MQEEIERGKERGQTAAERPTEKWMREEKRESERLVGDIKRGSFLEAKWEKRLDREWNDREGERENEREREIVVKREGTATLLIRYMVLSSLVVLRWNNHGIHLITSVSLKNMGFHKCADKCFNHNCMAFCNQGFVMRTDITSGCYSAGQPDSFWWFVLL